MPSCLDSARESIDSISDAIRQACILEATAPKAGNVYPGQSFDSLEFNHFVTAADILAKAMSNKALPVARRALVACEETYCVTGTNVNLGIVLLITPLVAAAELSPIKSHAQWPEMVQQWLSEITAADSVALFHCIRVMTPGGMGQVDEMDVQDTTGDLNDIVAAMKLASGRDRVAAQYAGNFNDLIDHVVPVVDECLRYSDDALSGIADAHLRLLATSPDTLIARKCGALVAADVQHRAGQVDLDDDESRQQFDLFLRSDGNRLNPGTTADLIAAALFVLLSTSNNRIFQ